MNSSVNIFEQYRPSLFNLAYGMLGRVAPAEDAVQEAYLRWQKVNHDSVKSNKAYLSTIVHRICLDEIKSAKNQREQYIGPDLPEPLFTSKQNNPEQDTELADSLSMALLTVLKQLTPTQRAVFLLREVFDYDYNSIAGIIDKSESYCRKIDQRARNRVKKDKPIFEPTREEQQRIIKLFIEAAQNGNLSDLEEMLASDAILYSDGGGKVTAAPKPIYGADKIARFLIGIQNNDIAQKLRIEFEDINGRRGLLFYLDNKLYAVWTFFINNGEIDKMFFVLNPDKLKHLKETN